MSRIIKIKGYKVSELSGTAREKALSYVRDCVDFLSDEIIDGFRKRIFDKYGFRVDEAFFDMSCSQGSGACFNGSTETQRDSERFWEALGIKPTGMKTAVPGVKIFQNWLAGRYTHSNTVDVSLFDYPEDAEDEDEILRAAKDWKNERCAELYRELAKEWEATYCDDNLIAVSEDAGDYFDYTGRIIL